MDAWSDEELDLLEQRVDYALRTEDDGRTLIVAPQAIKDLIAAVRSLRSDEVVLGSSRPSPSLRT